MVHHLAPLARGVTDASTAWLARFARAPPRGDTRERTFENAYLEYASLVGLARDTGIDLWFLMDPLEDNPDRSMADYYGNYVRTLAASLFFPEVSKYETMPWPTRIFGRVPDEFATTICTVVGALADIQNHAEWSITGASADATSVADSLQWQRGILCLRPTATDSACLRYMASP